MRHCQACGKPLPDGNQFCEHCGAKIPLTNEPSVPLETIAGGQAAAPSEPAPVAAKPKSNKTTVIILASVCGFLVVALVVVFCVFILPELNKPDISIPSSPVINITTGYVDIPSMPPVDVTMPSADAVPTERTTRTTRTTTTTTTRATTTTTRAPALSHVKSYEIIADGIIVRDGPSSDAAPILRELYKGYTFTSSAKQGEWIYADFGAVDGWVHISGVREIDLLTETPGFAASSVERNGRVRTQDGDGVNLRKGPSTSYDIIQPILENQVMYVISREGDWYYVEYNGMNGWVSSEFIVLMY